MSHFPHHLVWSLSLIHILYMPLAENVEVAVGRGSYYSIGIHPWEVRESNAVSYTHLIREDYRKNKSLLVDELQRREQRLAGAFIYLSDELVAVHPPEETCSSGRLHVSGDVYKRQVDNQGQTELFRQLYLFLKHR